MRIEQRKRLGITAHHGAGQRAAAPGTRRNGAARRAGAHHWMELWDETLIDFGLILDRKDSFKNLIQNLKMSYWSN